MELNFDDEALSGFRLSRFEFYNWGTYNNSIISLDLNKTNALLTGDIGSGKSTIVDALTTILVPHQKIIYNKAAGAASKERSIRSYILGEYKSSKDDNYSSSKAVALRDENSFSVLLSHFANDGFDEVVTLAQFFYVSNSKEQKFFVVSKNKLTIKKDFFDFKDVKILKKRLRSISDTSVYDSFSDYSKDFRRVMGIKNEQALNLFYQTVSLKEIGNLTSFIRTHMLEKGDIEQKVDELCKNFSDLNHAHKSVLRAKRQIELLTPISKEGSRYKKDVELKDVNEKLRDALSEYFAFMEIKLVNAKMEELEIELKKSDSNKTKIDRELKELRQKELELKIELEQNGGNRINAIDGEMKSSLLTLKEKKEKNQEYNDLAKSLDFPVVSNEHRFLNNANDAMKNFEGLDAQLTKIQNERVFNAVAKTRYEESATELSVEIAYLKNNRSNIPQKISSIRREMAKSLNLRDDELPFVGELVRVTDPKWEGAIERVLNSFAISILVAEELYEGVVSYVEKTNLRGKLVYLKVSNSYKRDNFVDVLSTSLIRKIEIKADSRFFESLQETLNDRFNIPCVESVEEFKRFKKALTISGQFKTSLSRHEKDDRFDINNKSRWVLGWDNLAKLNSLEAEYENLDQKIEMLSAKIGALSKDEKSFQKQRDALRDILNFKNFSEIDWYEVAKKIEALDDEKKALETSSDIIKTLQEEIYGIERNIEEKSEKADIVSKTIGKLETNLQTNSTKKSNLNAILQNAKASQEISAKIDALFDEAIVDEKTNLNNISKQESLLRAKIQSKLSSLTQSIQKVGEKMVKLMSEFISEFPNAAKDFDAAAESLDEFNEKLEALKKDDLPKWEKRFNELFKEGTIRNILLIQEELEHQSHEIKEKIDSINSSLKDIEYNDGTFVELIAEQGADIDIRDFKQTLKSATAGSIESDNSYDENKFLEIKKIIDRFNGRDGYVDVDKKWTQKVTDVRNWFNFAASERYFSDGSEKEYYAHSGGKSGGQKEKLAYTVLASSLAFQFGVEYEQIKSRSFRFVMIDEAFGRGSDESTKYALRLFDKLKLQLLVITPKQKINVIESFVKTVHFVANPDGMNSSLLSMSIEDYQKNKAKR